MGGSWKGAGGVCKIEAVSFVTVARGSTWGFVCLCVCVLAATRDTIRVLENP